MHDGQGDGPMVLVADDDRDIRELVTFKLQRSGLTVEAVEDGISALDRARHRRPDLVVLDVLMPGLSGLDVAKRLREDDRTAGVPVILLTARTRQSDVEAGFSAGAADALLRCGSVGVRALGDLARLQDGVRAREVLARAPRREVVGASGGPRPSRDARARARHERPRGRGRPAARRAARGEPDVGHGPSVVTTGA